MNNFMKVTTLALTMAVALPTFAHASDAEGRVKAAFARSKAASQAAIERRVQQAFSHTTQACEISNLEYVRSLENALAANEVSLLDEKLSSQAFYNELVRLSKEALNGAVKDKAPLRAFGLMSQKFQEELGVDPSAATMEQYQKFYQLHKSNPIVLPMVAIWANHSIDGLLPYRHQANSFWAIPTQAAKMYNTMAALNREQAYQSLVAYIEEDLKSAYATFPEGDLGESEEVYAHEFFTEFAQAGGYAKQDGAKLEQEVVRLLNEAD